MTTFLPSRSLTGTLSAISGLGALRSSRVATSAPLTVTVTVASPLPAITLPPMVKPSTPMRSLSGSPSSANWIGPAVGRSRPAIWNLRMPDAPSILTNCRASGAYQSVFSIWRPSWRVNVMRMRKALKVPAKTCTSS